LEDISVLLEESGLEFLVAHSEIDRVAFVKDGKASFVHLSDQISYESISPFQLVEYVYENGIFIYY
jgi:hypothetical protein